MTTQTIERQNLQHLIDNLPDSAISKMVEFAAFLNFQENWKEHIPNAESLSAMREIASDEGEAITLEMFKAELDALG